jgi:predicted nucleotidyltransferase
MAKMTLDELVAQLRSAYGKDLRTVVLYGSAAAGEHIPKRSDYNVLVIVESLGLDRLRNAAAVARAWGEAGNPPPLTLTMSEWRGSADIFPMEYADILDRHRVLYGDPPFDGIRVSPQDLRLQLELETMGKLLKLRQGVLAAGGDEKGVVELLARSLSTIMVIFRAVLRLHAETPPTDNTALASAVARVAGLKAAPFERVVRHVRGEKAIAPAESAEVLGGYLEGMERLVTHLDRFQQTNQ